MGEFQVRGVEQGVFQGLRLLRERRAQLLAPLGRKAAAVKAIAQNGITALGQVHA